MSHHLVTCLPEEGLSDNNYQHPTSAFSLRNRGSNESSKRSNGSVHQGIKVGSAEEHNQYILNPQRVRQQVNALSPSKVIQSALRKLGIPRRAQHSPAQYMNILNKHPRQSWSKTVPRRYTRHSVEPPPRYISN